MKGLGMVTFIGFNTPTCVLLQHAANISTQIIIMLLTVQIISYHCINIIVLYSVGLSSLAMPKY